MTLMVEKLVSQRYAEGNGIRVLRAISLSPVYYALTLFQNESKDVVIWKPTSPTNSNNCDLAFGPIHSLSVDLLLESKTEICLQDSSSVLCHNLVDI